MGWFRRSKHPEAQLAAYLDGELGPRQAGAVERHLAGCVACSALLEELRAAKSMLAALPRQTPRRSFVLGPEHQRASALARPSRRPALAFAPAIALTVLVALLAIDLGSVNPSSPAAHDQASSAQKAAANREAVTADSAASAPGLQGYAPATPGAAGGAVAQGSAAAQGTPLSAFSAPVAPNAAAPPSATGSATGSAGAGAPGPAVSSSGETPADQPQALPANGTGSGPSTLRILEIVAGVAFITSSLYVFAWPRLKSRGESQK